MGRKKSGSSKRHHHQKRKPVAAIQATGPSKHADPEVASIDASAALHVSAPEPAVIHVGTTDDDGNGVGDGDIGNGLLSAEEIAELRQECAAAERKTPLTEAEREEARSRLRSRMNMLHEQRMSGGKMHIVYDEKEAAAAGVIPDKRKRGGSSAVSAQTKEREMAELAAKLQACGGDVAALCASEGLNPSIAGVLASYATPDGEGEKLDVDAIANKLLPHARKQKK